MGGANTFLNCLNWAGRNRFLALSIALALTSIAGLRFKTHCLIDGVWYDFVQYTTGCYSEAVPFWSLRGVAAGQAPYFQAQLEYPVLSGGLVWLEGIMTKALFGVDAIATDFLFVVVLANALLALLVLKLLLRLDLPQARLWAWAASPLVLIFIGHNWDMLAVAFTIGALLMARDNRLIVAATLSGLGASAKLYPALLVPILCLQALVTNSAQPITQRIGRAFLVGSAAFAAWLAVNAPVALFAFDNWSEFYRFSSERGPTGASIWGILEARGLLPISHELRNHLAIFFVIFGSSIIFILGWKRHTNHIWILFTPVLAWFILVNKVYSPQFDIWIYPVLLLTVRRSAPIAIFAVGSFLTYYFELWWFSWQEGGAFGLDRWALELAAIIRAFGLLWAMGSVIFEPAPAWIPGGQPFRNAWTSLIGQALASLSSKLSSPSPNHAEERDEWGRTITPPLQTKSKPKPSISKALIYRQPFERDPLAVSAIVTGAFLSIASYGLLSPSSLYFDETHYIPAARSLLQLVAANAEHPLLAKEILAASIAMFGDHSFSWRLPSLLAGVLGLFAFGRLIWWTSRRRYAAIAAMVLLGTNFLWFIQSRIAMLDIFAAAFLLIALWQFAAAVSGDARTVRIRLIATGIFLGLALAAKWSVAPLLPLPGLYFAVLCWRDQQHLGEGKALRSLLFSPDCTWRLADGLVYLGLLPLCIYWLTFTPAFFYTPADTAISPFDVIGQQFRMLASQASAVGAHPNQSVWSDWILNREPVWYLYENVDGAQRGVLLLGNPLTMLASLPAVAWCCWAGLRHQRSDTAVFVTLYLIAIGFWVFAAKPVQFYYHYLLPATFLIGCMALALDRLFAQGGLARWIANTALAASSLVFVWFYPIISAIPLQQGPASFETWMWSESWR